MGTQVTLKGVVLTPSGELVVAPLKNDDSYHQQLDATATAFNFVPPKVGFQFVITGFIAVSDKNITADAIVDIYEATSDTETTISKILLKFAMTKNQSIPANSLRILVSEGVWVNAKTDDATIHITLFGYYINKL